MLSILIVNWNTRDFLRACLKSIKNHPPTGDFEVIVVDNASTDQSADMVRSEFPEVVLVASNKNTGYARGNNLAFEQAKGDFLLTLNPDTEFDDPSLDEAVHEPVCRNDGSTFGREVDPSPGVKANVESSLDHALSLNSMGEAHKVGVTRFGKSSVKRNAPVMTEALNKLVSEFVAPGTVFGSIRIKNAVLHRRDGRDEFER